MGCYGERQRGVLVESSGLSRQKKPNRGENASGREWEGGGQNETTRELNRFCTVMTGSFGFCTKVPSSAPKHCGQKEGDGFIKGPQQEKRVFNWIMGLSERAKGRERRGVGRSTWNEEI